MSRTSIILLAAFAVMVVVPAAWSVSVEVNKSGNDSAAGGPYKTIQAAIDYCQLKDDGPDVVTITDSGLYEENFYIGDEMDASLAPVELTSNKTGDDRPVISPLEAYGPFIEVHRDDRYAGTAIYSNGSKLSNVILESNPDTGTGNGASALHLEANDVIIENVLVRPRAGTSGVTKYPNTGIFLSQEGDPATHQPEPNGRRCDGVIIRNCDFWGVATDGQLEPDDTAPGEATGYLKDGDNGQFATLIRCDNYPDPDETITVTIDNCTFQYSYDAGIFPSNRGDHGQGIVNFIIRDCFFDAFGKFAVRSRGVFLTVERCVFSRTNQGNNGDGENSAVAQQTQGGNSPDSTVSNCLFVNCGGAFAKKAYYGGVRNHSGGIMQVNYCTFDLCNSGVSVGDAEEMDVSNCIFNRIGYNMFPSIDADGVPIEAGQLYETWESEWFDPTISAVFNNYTDGNTLLKANNCLVGDIASEDTSDWTEVDPTWPKGCRLTAGFVEGMDTVVRGDPMFANTDIHAANPYELAAGSPAIDVGVDAEPDPGDVDLDGTPRQVNGNMDLGCQELPGAAVHDWSLF